MVRGCGMNEVLCNDQPQLALQLGIILWTVGNCHRSSPVYLQCQLHCILLHSHIVACAAAQCVHVTRCIASHVCRFCFGQHICVARHCWL